MNMILPTQTGTPKRRDKEDFIQNHGIPCNP